MFEKKHNDSGICNEKEEIENELLNDFVTVHDPKARDVIRNATHVPCTSSEVMRAFQPYDNTIEIVGYAENVQPSRSVDLKNVCLFKFLLYNGDGERVQVTASNDEVKKAEGFIKNEMLVHLEGVYGRIPKSQLPNKGTINLERNIEKYTTIDVFGMMPEDCPEEVALSDGYTQVEGFLKMAFRHVDSHAGQGTSYGSGAITNGQYMLRLRIVNYDDEHDFHKGDHVIVKGYMRQTANPIFFNIHRMLDVTKKDYEQTDFVTLLGVTQEVPLKRGAGPQGNVISKKSKKE